MIDGNDNALADFSRAIDIAAPPATVWDVMADVERWREWTASVTSIRRMDTGPLRVGSRAWIRQSRFPPALWTVTDLNDGRSFTWKSGASGMYVFAHHSVTPVAHGAHAVLSLRYEGLIARVLRA